MGIDDYTIATTSLEDVFIKLNVSEQTKNMDEIKLTEGLEIQNNPQDLHNETSSFCTQLCTSIKRNMIPLYRSKSNFIIELISSITILFIYAIIQIINSRENKDENIKNGIIILYFTFIGYSGFTLNAVVKEKEKNIKHLLYLSGNNMYCYWLGFFVVDMIKYFILIIISFSIMFIFKFKVFILLVPVFIFFCFTMTMFLYFFSFLISKEEQAQKSYFVLLFLILIAIPLVSLIVFNYLIEIMKIDEIIYKILQYFYKPYFITIAEITPMTSLMIALFRIYTSIYLYYNRKDDYEDDMIPKPYVLIITHCIYFIVEFFIWGYLIYLCEIGYLTDLWNKFLKSYCLNKEYEFSTEVPVNDGFIIQDNLPNYNTQNNNNPQIINNESGNNLINDNEFNTNNNSMNSPLINNINIEQNNNNQLMGNKYVQEQIEKVNNNLDLTTRIVGLTKTFCFYCKKKFKSS